MVLPVLVPSIQPNSCKAASRTGSAYYQKVILTQCSPLVNRLVMPAEYNWPNLMKLGARRDNGKLRFMEAKLSEFIAYFLLCLGRTQTICKQNFTKLSLPITDLRYWAHFFFLPHHSSIMYLPSSFGSEHGALRGLRELNVLLDEHLPLQFLQHRLDRVLPVPPGQHGHSAGVHLANRGENIQ